MGSVGKACDAFIGVFRVNVQVGFLSDFLCQQSSFMNFNRGDGVSLFLHASRLCVPLLCLQITVNSSNFVKHRLHTNSERKDTSAIKIISKHLK